MTSPDTHDYSRDAIVNAITSYYEFLRRTNSDKSHWLEIPPPTGWPQVKRELFPMYTEEVVDLIRHLPYITHELIKVLPDTRVINYIDSCSLKFLVAAESETVADDDGNNDEGTEVEDDKDETQFPPHILELATGNRNWSSILVDALHGSIIWWKYGADFPKDICLGDAPVYQGCIGGNDSGGEEVEIDQYSDDAWMIMPTYRPETFVKMCKDQFKSMNWMPALDYFSQGSVIEYSEQDLGPKMRKILFDAGWPGDGEGRGWDIEMAQNKVNKMKGESD